jgi:hypothetical protein
MRSKYIVFKREDWDQLQQESPECDPEEFILEDAVVIRLQDIFAESALFAYAASIRTSCEILEVALGDVDQALVDNLNETADYFMACGEQASKSLKRKIPD